MRTQYDLDVMCECAMKRVNAFIEQEAARHLRAMDFEVRMYNAKRAADMLERYAYAAPWVQKFGRALREAKNPCLVLDHAGNSFRYPLSTYRLHKRNAEAWLVLVVLTFAGAIFVTGMFGFAFGCTVLFLEQPDASAAIVGILCLLAGYATLCGLVKLWRTT